jgi:hypothetical protein
MTFEQILRLEDREFRQVRKFVIEEWRGDYPISENYSIPKEEGDRRIREFSNFMDIIGAFYLKGYFDEDLLIGLYGSFIVKGFKKIEKPFIDYWREKMGTDRYQENFSKMAIKLEVKYREKFPLDHWLDRNNQTN